MCDAPDSSLSSLLVKGNIQYVPSSFAAAVTVTQTATHRTENVRVTHSHISALTECRSPLALPFPHAAPPQACLFLKSTLASLTRMAATARAAHRPSTSDVTAALVRHMTHARLW